MKKVTSLFYTTDNGNKPVREWLLSLEKEDRKVIGKNIKLVEYGWPIGMPICKKLVGTKLYEIRCNISKQRIARVIFVIMDEYIILLNGFIKKDQKTPKNEIDISLQRMKDIKWN